MKNLAVILLMVMMAMSCGNAQKIQEKDIPAAVKSALRKQYSDVTKVKWNKEQNEYEAGFEINETDYSVLIDASGIIIETEAEIGVDALPSTVKDYVSKNYPGKKIKEAAKITDAEGTVTYEAEVKGKDLIFDSNGNFIIEKKDEGEKD